ncbi:MAG: RecQ family ATP-dependent DNA helicase [Flavobacteriaceae bacterium]|nr:RecQ family ATP-dependent DNA helicase [Flavobacteriaceae bacterium]
MVTALEVLQKYWKYTSFKKPQKEIIDLVLDTKNVIAVLPTGGGKSICYQVPGMIKEGVCLVISPLIALMNDQVSSLKEIGIKAIAITSALHQTEIINAFDNLLFGNYKFLYLSPEKLQSKLIQEKIKQLNINLIAIDEVHCISEWGHDFRPAYLKIPIIYELHPNTPVIGLTATATSTVLKDISKQLNIPDIKIIKQSLVRKNLALNVIKSEDFYYHIKQILNDTSFPSILYASSRKKVKSVSDYLNKNNFKSTFYHGGLSTDEKQLSFSNWMQEKTPIMVATNAFGMGIDKKNVQNIIHLDLPNSLENYMQEAGRAGRNENEAFSYIFASEHCISNLKKQFLKGKVSIEFAKNIYKTLNQYFQVSYGELPEQSFEFHLTDFCSHYSLNILQTYNTLKLLEKEEILHFNENFNRQSTLKFAVSPDEILRYSEKNNSNIIRTILRSYGGIFEAPIKINETIIAKKLGLTFLSVKNELEKLSNNEFADYNFKNNNSKIQFLVPREDDITIRKIATNISHLNSIKSDKINAIISYVNNDTICRSSYLLSYFNEKNIKDCGICDVCIKSTFKNHEQLSKEILTLFSSKQSLSTKEVIAHFNIDNSTILTTIQLLLDTNKITITSQNKLEKV